MPGLSFGDGAVWWWLKQPDCKNRFLKMFFFPKVRGEHPKTSYLKDTSLNFLIDFLDYLDLIYVICYQKMKGIFFAGRNPKFPCSNVALSKVLLSKVHSSWWTLTMIFSTCKVDVSFLSIGAYVKLIDHSSGINNAVDILNNSP